MTLFKNLTQGCGLCGQYSFGLPDHDNILFDYGQGPPQNCFCPVIVIYHRKKHVIITSWMGGRGVLTPILTPLLKINTCRSGNARF